MSALSFKVVGKSFKQGSKIGISFFLVVFALIILLNLLMDWFSNKPLWPYFTMEFLVNFIASPLFWATLIFLILLFSLGDLIRELKSG